MRHWGVASEMVGSNVARERSYPVEFEALYRATRTRMVDLALLTTGSRALAEEIVQDVFAELLRRWDGVREPERWLRVAVVNRCTSWVRRRRVERGYLARHAPGVDAFHEPDALVAFDLLQRLNPRQRAVLALRFIEGWSEVEVASALGMRVGTVKSTVSRARQSLREAFSDDD